MKKYAETHEWIDSASGEVGITAHAIELLGDIVFLELPEVGRTIAKGDGVAVVESVKAASDIYAPVAGEVVAVNSEVADNPESLGDNPDTWLFKITIADAGDLDSLMDENAYTASLDA